MSYFLYVAGTTMPNEEFGPTKVGISKNVHERVDALRTGCPFAITHYFAFKLLSRNEARSFERELISEFQEEFSGCAGEWSSIPFDEALERTITFFQLTFREDCPREGEFNKKTLREIGVYAANSYHEAILK